MKKGIEFSHSPEELKEYKVISRFQRHFDPEKDPGGFSLDKLSEKGKKQGLARGEEHKVSSEAEKIKKVGRSPKERTDESLKYMFKGADLEDIEIYKKEELDTMAIPDNVKNKMFFKDEEKKEKRTFNETMDFVLNHPDMEKEVEDSAERLSHRVNVALKIPRILAKGDEKLKQFSEQMGNDVLLENVTHGPVQEAFLKKVVILEDSKGNKKRGFDRVEEIGGAFQPGEGFEIETVVNDRGEQEKKLFIYRLDETGAKITQRKELTVDWDEINRLGENYKKRKVEEVKDRKKLELAWKSMDKKERELTSEEKEEFKKLKEGAKNVIDCFQLKRSADNKKWENLLIIVDSGVDELMIKALYEAGRKAAGDDCRLVVAPKTKHAAQDFKEAIGEKMKTADAILLLTSLSRSHSKETAALFHPEHSAEFIEYLFNKKELETAFPELRKKREKGEKGYTSEDLAKKIALKKFDKKESDFPGKARVISITNARREILTEGAALENPKEMSERIDKIAEIMEGVEKVRITSANGTNLELDIKVPTLFKENGINNKPGQIANFPAGEYGGAADLQGTNGVFVVDGAVGMIGAVKEPIKITIENGIAVKIEGGKEAERLKEILNKANDDYRKINPNDEETNTFRLGEFAFGTNSKAFRYDDGGKRISPPTSLEGEKGLGTVHIALGKNALFSVSPEDPDYNDIPIHIDCVAMETSVIGIKGDGTEVELIKNGEMVCL